MRGALGVFFSALFLTLIMAAPVLQAPADRLFGREIVGRHEAPFVVISQFEHPRLPGLYTQPATDYVGAGIAALVGNGVVAYNFLVLASFPLAALFAYLFAFHLTGSRAASWLAGLLYAFAPYHLAQSAYHPHGAQTQWLPLFLLALWLSLERWSPRRALLVGLSLALVVLSNFYYGLMAALLTPFALLGFWLAQRTNPEGSVRGLKKTILTLGGAAILGGAYVLAVAPGVLSSPDSLAFPREDLVQYGARWWSYVTPPVEHPILAQWAGRVWARHGIGGLLEQQITVGVGLLALAGIALACRFGGHKQGGLSSAPGLAVLGAAAFVFSLSPPPEPGPLDLAWPATLVYRVLPMFRAYARFGVIVFLAVVILAVIGGACLWRRRTLGPRILAAGLLMLAAVELTPLPPLRWREILPTQAHRWMASQPAPWQLLDCRTANTAVAQSIARFLHQPTSLLTASLSDCAEPGLPGRLAAKGFSHLLLRRGSAEDLWLDDRNLPEGLVEERRFEDSRLLRIGAPPATVYVDLWRGFSWREYAGDRTFRWLGPSGEWRLVNGAAMPLEGRLELELWALGGARDLDFSLDGAPLATLRVEEQPGWHVAGPMALGPGAHRLGWRPGGAPVVPDDVLGNGDTRRLTVAVGGWRWRQLAMPAVAD